jgi:hypothetical protein
VGLAAHENALAFIHQTSSNYSQTAARAFRANQRRARAVTFAGPTRSLTVSLEVVDLDKLEWLAIKDNIRNGPFVRRIIREYLEKKQRS